MRAVPSRVGCIGLLDRPLVAARAPADSFLLASCRNNQAVSNARHHPRPHSTYMRGTLMGRRVHAVVSPPADHEGRFKRISPASVLRKPHCS